MNDLVNFQSKLTLVLKVLKLFDINMIQHWFVQ